MSIRERVSALQKIMNQKQIDAYIISGSDPHQSEITPQRWAVREWISGFTGSAGTVVVTQEKAGLWTDFRYYIQAEKQLKNSGITLFKQGLPGVPEPAEWIRQELQPGACVSAAAEELSADQYKKFLHQFTSVDILFKTSEDLVDKVWIQRPEVPGNRVYEIPETICGKSREEKIREVLAIASNTYKADFLLLSSLDDIAWLLNLRGSDVAYNPLFLSYLLLGKEKTLFFCDSKKIPDSIRERLSGVVEIFPYTEVFQSITKNIRRGSRVLLSPEKTNMRLYQEIAAHAEIVEGRDITTELKAVKNSVELAGMRRIHKQDGAAMVGFLSWFEKNAGKLELDECSTAEKLLDYRKKQLDFLGESFSPIVAFGANGALCHYLATAETAAEIAGHGLVVLDSGGQYNGGTTDITRTLLVGKPTVQEIREYTLVLKGHLAVSRQKFPEGTCGYQIDAFARKPLWDMGINFGHGTGHGIGFMLNVHEGPQSISPKPVNIPLKPGMILSNEPGIYREGKFGIRIENLLVVAPAEETDFGKFLCFEDITRCPYDRKLIDTNLLTKEEVEQINSYHSVVFEDLYSVLDKEEKEWLQHKTKPL
ncbi:MAG: aminopeptidase P family protein [Spirochaetia bacterium]|nr:aminopeptidase P family protein [Spirochaetia bacterium]